MFQRVTIVGLGLIGGSLGLALRKAQAAQEIIGFDLGQGVCAQACRSGAIDRYFDALADAVYGADLVVLATPVGAVQHLLRSMASHLTPGTVVTDVSSTKVQVLQWADEILPRTVSFVGGHPMAGKEVSGVGAADPDLFRDRIYCVTPTQYTPSTAIKKVCFLIEALGARVRFLDAHEHDHLVASVSHLPFLASVALMNTVTQEDSWSDASRLAANGFRDVSRLAAGSPEMYRDICLTNSDAIVHWLDAYIQSLQELRRMIALQEGDINEVFLQAQQARLHWQAMQEESLHKTP